MIGGYLMSPFICENHLKRDEYLIFLQNELPRLPEDVLLNIGQKLSFQQDGKSSSQATFECNISPSRTGLSSWPPLPRLLNFCL